MSTTLTMILMIFVCVLTTELIALKLISNAKKRIRRKYERNVKDDSTIWLADFAYKIHELACMDMNIDVDIPISIYDLGDLSNGTCCINHERRIAYKIIANPDQSLENLIETILHETRHVYQTIATPEAVFDVQYVSFDRDSDDEDAAFKAYAEQPIEVDARAYAEHAMKKYKREIHKLVKYYYTKH